MSAVIDIPLLCSVLCKNNKATAVSCDIDSCSCDDNGHSQRWSQVTELALQGKGIKRVCCLDVFEQLRKLSLEKNQISSVETLSSLENLRILDLSCNSLCNIDRITQLPHLEELYLSQNRIAILPSPGSLKQLAHLKILSLSYNCITDRAELLKLRHNSNLQCLMVHGNPAVDGSKENREKLFSEVLEAIPSLLNLDDTSRSEGTLRPSRAATSMDRSLVYWSRNLPTVFDLMRDDDAPLTPSNCLADAAATQLWHRHKRELLEEVIEPLNRSFCDATSEQEAIWKEKFSNHLKRLEEASQRYLEEYQASTSKLAARDAIYREIRNYRDARSLYNTTVARINESANRFSDEVARVMAVFAQLESHFLKELQNTVVPVDDSHMLTFSRFKTSRLKAQQAIQIQSVSSPFPWLKMIEDAFWAASVRHKRQLETMCGLTDPWNV